MPTDLNQAQGWYRRAASQGHMQAEDNLGLVLFTLNQREEAMRYITRSAARGEPRAQYVLGTAHFNGDLAPQDWPRAYALVKRASDASLGIASARLAQLDRMIPLEQRQQGLAMLPEMERDEQRARLAAATAAIPSAPRMAEAGAVQAQPLPPSLPAATYTPPPVIAQAATPPPPAVMTMPSALPSVSAKDQRRADKAAQRALKDQAKRQARAARAGSTSGTGTALPPMIASGSAVPPPPSMASLPPAAVPVPVQTPTSAPPVIAARPVPGPLASADLPPSGPAAAGTSYAPPAMDGTPAPVPAPTPTRAAATLSPRATPTASGAWRIQLGAFSDEARARALWTSLETRIPALASRQPYLVKAGAVTRLQAGDYAARADAGQACAVVTAAGQACLIVRR